MNGKTQREKIILGLKIKQLRQEKSLSLSDLSKRSGLSVSYINEIEKGKKSPKANKLAALADALSVTYEELVSNHLPNRLEPVKELLESNFLNDLPLELFSIELSKVVEIIVTAPAEVSAFISTLMDLSRNYAVQQESFYFAALRSYLELHDNYFHEIEQAVEDFLLKYDLPTEEQLTYQQLQPLLEREFRYKIIDNGLDEYTTLSNLRSVFIPKKRKLLLNSQLTDMQKAFQFGKELGFCYLNLNKRANTSSLLKAGSFDEVLNHSKAIYFSVALLMNRAKFTTDVKALFQRKSWDGNTFLGLMESYGASPEMFYHRLTNILPTYLGLKKIFFTRFVNSTASDLFEIDKELHLDNRHHPHRNELNEHYCRRWIAVSILKELKTNQIQAPSENQPIIAIQRATYFGTDDEYLCLTIARAAYPSPNRNVSATLGLYINDHLKQQLRFWDDPNIPNVVVNKTCERCPIPDCVQRVAPPIVIRKQERGTAIKATLQELMELG